MLLLVAAKRFHQKKKPIEGRKGGGGVVFKPWEGKLSCTHTHTHAHVYTHVQVKHGGTHESFSSQVGKNI